MDVKTGKLVELTPDEHERLNLRFLEGGREPVPLESSAQTDSADRKPKAARYIPVMRDLTLQEKAEMQIKRYSPCGCGSGKKFKFCCYRRGGK